MHEHLNADLYILEHIQPIPFNQKKYCDELYSFPRQLIQDPLFPRLEKEHLIERLLGCYLSTSSDILFNEHYSSFQQQERHWPIQ